MAETDQEKKSQQEEQEKLLPEAEEHEGLEGSGEALNPVIQPMGNEGSPDSPDRRFPRSRLRKSPMNWARTGAPRRSPAKT